MVAREFSSSASCTPNSRFSKLQENASPYAAPDALLRPSYIYGRGSVCHQHHPDTEMGIWAPRKIAPTHRTPQNCLRMIPLRSRSDSLTFAPRLSAIGSESNFRGSHIYIRNNHGWHG